MIQENIDILDYAVYWRTKSETGLIGELFHITRNSSGGSLRTPVGYVVGFVEPASEYYASYWKIILNIREEIRYNLEDNTTYVFVKSAYASKLKYHFQRLSELTQEITRINPELPTAIKGEFIKQRLCTSPLSIQMTVGTDRYFYSDVVFNFD